MGFGFRFRRVLALAILAGISGCVISGGEGSLGGEPGPNIGRDLAADHELAQLITGSWVVSGEDLSRELSIFFESDWELRVETAASNGIQRRTLSVGHGLHSRTIAGKTFDT